MLVVFIAVELAPFHYHVVALSYHEVDRQEVQAGVHIRVPQCVDERLEDSAEQRAFAVPRFKHDAHQNSFQMLECTE